MATIRKTTGTRTALRNNDGCQPLTRTNAVTLRLVGHDHDHRHTAKARLEAREAEADRVLRIALDRMIDAAWADLATCRGR